MPLKHHSLHLLLVCQQLYYMMPKELKNFESRDCVVVLFFSWLAIAIFDLVYILLKICQVLWYQQNLFHLPNSWSLVHDCTRFKPHAWSFINVFVFSHIMFMLVMYHMCFREHVCTCHLPLKSPTLICLHFSHQKVNSLFHWSFSSNNTAVCCTQQTWELTNPYSLIQKRFTWLYSCWSCGARTVLMQQLRFCR